MLRHKSHNIDVANESPPRHSFAPSKGDGTPLKRKINTDITRVYLSPLDTYEQEKVRETLFPLLDAMLSDNKIEPESLSGKKVVIKPNLLTRREAKVGITTHPSFVRAAAEFFVGLGAAVVVADSPGGTYSQGVLNALYKTTGIYEACEQSGATANTDTSYSEVREPEISRLGFSIINPLIEADLIVNLCRLKTHALCEMSTAVKNMFGSIPGLQKAEQHARFPKRLDFADMLCDLCMINAPQINITDGVCGMEGNGPAGGTLRDVGVVIASANPFASDLVSAYIIGYEPDEVGTVQCSVKRGFCPGDISGLEIVGDSPDKYKCTFRRPDSSAGGLLKQLPTIFGGRLQKFLEPRPVVNTKKCIGCGACASVCPESTISVKDKKAHINPKNCIKCYCCQEFCPVKAVEIKQKFFFKL